MSIIYDALKKTQDNTNPEGSTHKENPKNDPELKRKLMLIYILAVCLAVFVGNTLFNYLTDSKTKSWALLKKPVFAPKQTAAPKTTAAFPVKAKTAATQQSKGSFVLNGIFFSENQGYALINNEIVRVGDKVGGAAVKRVGLDEVELEYEGRVIKLYNR